MTDRDSKALRGQTHNDHERAKLRGKGRSPDYPPGSNEGLEFTGEMGLSGDTTSLRGFTTGSQKDLHPERDIDAKREIP